MWCGITGQRPNWHEHMAIFVVVKQNKDMDGYTIRKRRNIVSLHPIVHRYTIESCCNFVEPSCLHRFFRL